MIAPSEVLPSSVQSTVLLAIAAGWILLRLSAWLDMRKRNPKGLPLPPGPPGFPIIGNAHQLVGKNIVSVMEKWAQTYGPIVHIKLFSTSVIVVSSSEAAKDMMETRHQICSGRPNFILASDTMQGGMMMPFIHANERFKRTRKLVTTELRPAAVKEYFNPIQATEMRRAVKCILDDPQGWKGYIARAVASIIMTGCYDKPIRSGTEADDAVKNVMRLNDEIVVAIEAGKNYVDFLPFLRYIPGIPYKTPAAEYYALAERTYKYLMDSAKSNLEGGKPARSIAARLLQRPDQYEADYREQYWSLGAFYLAGSDTQSVSSQIMMMTLALHPHVMARAQAEVDAVVGTDRLPTFEDEPNLPYLKAMIRELFRWRPVGPFAIPHGSVADDEYKGYFIPAGATIMPNIWSMHMDNDIFDRPEIFDPERYLKDPSLPVNVFGFGRRVCPGQRLAETTLLLEFATVAWACNVTPAVDEYGKPIPIDYNRESAFEPMGIMKPRPFQINITPRSPERTALLANVVDIEAL